MNPPTYEELQAENSRLRKIIQDKDDFIERWAEEVNRATKGTNA